MADFETVGTTKAQWGEGPVHHEGTLYWVDIEGHLVIAYDEASVTERTWATGERVGTVVPRASGGLMIAGASGFRFLDTETGTIQLFFDPESDLPENRFNDGKCDPAGRFWAGSIHLQKPRQPVASLWRLDGDGTAHRMVEGLTNSNGIVWNAAADTMYHIDTPTEKVTAYDYDRTTGAIANPRVVIDTAGAAGSPDGMAIDEEDKLWIAMCHGGEIRRYDPEGGELIETVAVPTLEVTAPAFGGPERKTLYVATGQSGLTEGDPLAGHLLATEVGVAGAKSYAYVG